MNKRLAKIAFLVLALPAAAAAFVWTRHAYQRELAQQPEAIHKTLARIKLPPGFKIRLYALVPGARHMAVGPQGKLIFVGTTETKVYAVTVDAASGVAGGVSEFVPAIEMNVPNGACFAKDGVLYVAEVNRVLSFPAPRRITKTQRQGHSRARQAPSGRGRALPS